MSFDPTDYNVLTVEESPIHGLYIVKLPVHGDERGWFKENYQKEKMEKLGLPVFEIVQNNVSFNKEKGVTRGMHAEPWEKFISVANGSVFGSWVDLRDGTGFGRTFSIEINPGTAVFVPRGVANGYQTLEDNVAYTYLVNAHWSPDVPYVAAHAYDPAIGIEWPISENQAILSDKDKSNPPLSEVTPLEND